MSGLAELMGDWEFDPAIVIPLALSLVLFATGYVRLRSRSSGGRKVLDVRAGLFALGWLALVVAVVSPLHEAAERSFAAHMAEHEVIMLAAPPVLVLSRPLAMMLWAFPAGGRAALGRASRSPVVRGPWRALTEPVTATVVQAVALWAWHLPSLFDLAVEDGAWHIVQHLSFLVSALLFWSAVLEGQGRRRPGLAAACLFATSVVSGGLGALMAVSQSPWYAPYAAMGHGVFGLTATEDQQLAGLLMWIPGGAVHVGAALAILARLLRRPEIADATVRP